LHVVDREQRRPAARDRAQHRPDRGSDRAFVRWCALRLLEQQRDAKRRELRRWEHRGDLREHVAEDVGESGEGKSGLGLDGPPDQGAESARMRSTDADGPESALADAGLA
jgi:hypothetical protein